MGDALKVRVCAPPEKGRANQAVERVIAKALGLSAKDVIVVVGQTNSRKTIEVKGINEMELYQRLHGSD